MAANAEVRVVANSLYNMKVLSAPNSGEGADESIYPAPTADFRLPPSLVCPLDSMPNSLLSSLSPPSPSLLYGQQNDIENENDSDDVCPLHSMPNSFLSSLSPPSPSLSYGQQKDIENENDSDDENDALQLALFYNEKPGDGGNANVAGLPVKMSAKPARRVALPKHNVAGESLSHPIAVRPSAPLSRKIVGGVPITKQRVQHKSKYVHDKIKALQRERSNYARTDRKVHPDGTFSLKHRDKDRDSRWAQLRVLQVRRWVGLFIKGNEDEYNNFGFIDEHEADMVDAMCIRAAYEAVDTPNSRTLETACAALWACALVQEVWAREHKGWVVEDENARDKMSFKHMESVCISVEGCKTVLPERHSDDSVELNKSKSQREKGVVRKFSSHAFGTYSQILAKLDCLDSLLKASDRFEGKGLHGDIARAKPPALIRAPKPGAQQTRRMEIRNSHTMGGNLHKWPSSSASSSS